MKSRLTFKSNSSNVQNLKRAWWLQVLRGFDEEMRDKVHEEYEKQGITFNTGYGLL